MMKRFVLLTLCLMMVISTPVMADVVSEIIAAEEVFGIDNSDKTAIERIAVLEEQLGITDSSGTLMERLTRIEKELGMSSETAEKNDNEKEASTEGEEEKTDIDLSAKSTIKAVQESLNKLGYDCGEPDGVLGKTTKKMIKKYKKENGLDVNSKVTIELIEMLGIDSSSLTSDTPETTAETENLETAENLLVIQAVLKAQGYDLGNPDGKKGPRTTAAIEQYKAAHGLEANSVVDAALMELIEADADEAAKAQAAKAEYSTDYSYEQLARNPEQYIYNKYKMTGKVLQAGDAGDETGYIRLALNSNYDTVVFVTYTKDIINYRILDDDNLTVYGTSYATYSYETVMGATITLPWINAEIIELNQ